MVDGEVIHDTMHRAGLAFWPRFRYRPRPMTRTSHHHANHHHWTRLGGPGRRGVL